MARASVMMVLVLLFAGCPGDDPGDCSACGDDDACEDPTPPEDPEDETEYDIPDDWHDYDFDVDDGVYLLLTLDTDDVLDDMAPFHFIVGDATWIGMGESAPTSGGYYQAKFRLLKFLIATVGVRAVAFDSPWYDARAVTDFTATCEDEDPSEDDVIAGLRPELHEEAVAGAMDWMCWWNRAFYYDQVRAFGFGVQQPWDDRDLLETFLLDALIGDVTDLTAGLETCNGVEAINRASYEASADYQQRLIGLDADDHSACVGGLSTLRAYLDDNEATLVAATSQDDLDWARVSLTGLEAWEESSQQFAIDATASQAALDAGAAYAAQEIHRLEHPGSKVVVWSDNRRMAEAHTDTTPVGDDPAAWTSVGQFLSEQVDYAAVGLVGYEVHTDWPGVDDPPLPTDDRSLEWLLHQYEFPYLAVDLSPNDGNIFLDDGEYIVSGQRMVPADQYEGLYFLDLSYAPIWLQ
jgi:erythromycin esterase-like protein